MVVRDRAEKGGHAVVPGLLVDSETFELPSLRVRSLVRIGIPDREVFRLQCVFAQMPSIRPLLRVQGAWRLGGPYARGPGLLAASTAADADTEEEADE